MADRALFISLQEAEDEVDGEGEKAGAGAGADAVVFIGWRPCPREKIGE